MPVAWSSPEADLGRRLSLINALLSSDGSAGWLRAGKGEIWVGHALSCAARRGSRALRQRCEAAIVILTTPPNNQLHADREMRIVGLRVRRNDGQHRPAQYQPRQISHRIAPLPAGLHIIAAVAEPPHHTDRRPYRIAGFADLGRVRVSGLRAVEELIRYAHWRERRMPALFKRLVDLAPPCRKPDPDKLQAVAPTAITVTQSRTA